MVDQYVLHLTYNRSAPNLYQTVFATDMERNGTGTFMSNSVFVGVNDSSLPKPSEQPT